MNPQANIKIIDYLSTLDYIVFFTIMAAVFLSVYIGNRLKNKASNDILDYLIMGRTLTLPMFIATLSATFYGGIFGVNEITFNHGIFGFITQGLMWYIAYFIFAFFIVNKISKYNAVTLPGLAKMIFGKKAEKITAIFSLFYILPVGYVLSLGIFIQLITGISLTLSMFIGVRIVCSYSAWSGFRAIVFSDIIQALCMFSSIILGAFFCIKTFGSPTILLEKLPPSYFQPTGNNTWLYTFLWGFIALGVLISPNFYQRCFAAKNPKIAKKGILISIGLWIIFDICSNLGVLYARAFTPEAEPASAFFNLAVQILPFGLKGFFIAGILATIFSTLDSFLFVSSNTITYDIIGLRGKKFIFSSFISIFLIGLICIVIANLFDNTFQSIWGVLGTFYCACVLIPILTAYIFPRYINDTIFTISSLSSCATILIWYTISILTTLKLTDIIDAIYIGIMTNIIIVGTFAIKKHNKSIYEK